MDHVSKKPIYLYVFLGIVFIGIILICFFPKSIISECGSKAQKIDVWTVVESEHGSKDVLIPIKLDFAKDEPYVICTELPETFKTEKSVCFWTENQDVTVYLDDQEIYNTTNQDNFGDAKVALWNYVRVPSESDGKMLYLSFSCPYDISEYWLDEVYYGTEKEIDDTLRHSYFCGSLIDNIMQGMGFSFILLGFIRKNEQRYQIGLILFGVMAILLATWLSFGLKGYTQVWFSRYTCTLLSYIAFSLIPIVLSIYLRIRVHRIKPFVVICDIFLFFDTLIVIAVFLMQALGVRDVRENLRLGYILLFSCIAWAIFVSIYYYLRERKHISVLTVISSFLFIIAMCAIYISENKLAELHFDTSLITRICAMVIIIFEFILLASHLQEKYKLQKAMEEQNENLKTQYFTTQIRPHFIMNTLGAIRAMIRVDAEKAYEMLYDFSKYIRKNIEEKDYSKPIPFLEEIDYIRTYLKLEQIRFGDRIKVKMELEYTDFWILPLTIQPFVENAIKHGLQVVNRGGTLWIRSYYLDERVYIEVEDDGVGFDVASLTKKFDEGKSLGMRSAMYRLKYKMNGTYSIKSNMEEKSSGTLIHIELPANWRDKDENNYRRR